MATMKAIVTTEPKTERLVTDRPIPKLRDDYILVKTVSVGLNPTDWKHIANISPPGVVVGCDYAGTVEAVGKDVQKKFAKGDRVCGFVHGGNAVQPEDGAFAEYLVAKGDIQWKIPDHMSFQEAATLGVGIITVGQGLYQSLKLVGPTDSSNHGNPILIYGGSTATGTLAIQFARLSGYKVLTTCSPRNFDLVRSLGADEVYDYKDPKAAEQIRNDTDNKLEFIFDCISTESSIAFADKAISTEGGQYSALQPVKFERANVNSRVTLAYTAIGEDFEMSDNKFPAIPENKAFAEKWGAIAEAMLARQKIKAHPPKIGQHGLKGVIEGLKLLKEDKVSGEKLVYNVSETP